MSIHKLTAGSGYDYLTRQVAAMDATEKGHVALAGYYTERGESPGVWIGSGLAGIDGLQVGDPVTAEQMRALFGVGLHPLAAQRQQQLQGPDLTSQDYLAVSRLGAPFKIYSNDIPPFQVQVAQRIAELNAAAGLPRDLPVPRSERARVRTEVARELFAAEHGRPPQDARELAAAIAKHSRPQTTAVAGYDLTFSPVKSVSTLWALADPAVAARIEKAHRAAVADALSFIEQHALFSRTGANGIRQVNVQGLVATAFTHRDSRAGDPDLHTHVAVANKVQTLDGRWLSIDGRILFKATVAASETYNTALENHLRDSLGLRFAERPNQDPRKRPVEPAAMPGGPRSQPISNEPTAAHPIRWNRCSWPSRPPWKPGKPNMSCAAWPSSGRHGLPKPSTCWADETPCSSWWSRRSTPRHRQHTRQIARGSTRQRIGCWPQWRNAVLPGRSGTHAPRRNATSEPPTCLLRRLIGWSTWSSTRY
jgi:hypothetical protein